jgi:hypothetical protein
MEGKKGVVGPRVKAGSKQLRPRGTDEVNW